MTTATGVEALRDQLPMIWVKKARDGYQVDRSTNDDIGMMAGKPFPSEAAVREAVVKNALLQGIPEDNIIFLEGPLPQR